MPRISIPPWTLATARFARAWAGILPFTTDNLPIIDALPGFENVFVAAGHVFGNGAGPTTGRLIADMVCGGEPIMDMAPFRADRPGLSDDISASVAVDEVLAAYEIGDAAPAERPLVLDVLR